MNDKQPPDELTAHTGKRRCRTRLIADTPSSMDDFGPHRRIATAIFELIDREPGGVAIGLEGDWGSGKSTIIKLLDGHLAASKSPRKLIVFNAWAHEGDPLRRTFLESLIHEMIGHGWVDPEEWNEQLDIIGRKKEQRKTTSHPHLTRLGKFMGLSLLLIPLGIALLGAALDSKPKFSLTFDPYLTVKVVAGLALILCPLLTYFICKRLLRFEKTRNWLNGPEPPPDPQNKCHHSNRTAKPKPVKPVASASASKPQQPVPQIEHMLLNRIMTEENTVTTKTPDPTAIEFEDVFTHLMRDALAEPDGDAANADEDPGQRRLVLVLDNLDRIAVKEALTIWSTLQSFLKQPQNERDAAWFKRVWIIVPYDRGGLSALWQNDRSGEGATAASFMDKSFQLRFEVPEPVRSEWRRFLVDRLKEAFPDHDGCNVALMKLNAALHPYHRREEALGEFAKLLGSYTTKVDVIGKLTKNFPDIHPVVLNYMLTWLDEFETREAEFHTVYRVLAIQLARQNKIPTIRELKLCVNQMGGIHRQWCEGFPLSHIAYFAMLRRPSETEVAGLDIVKALLEGAIIDPPGAPATIENATALAGSRLRRSFPEEEIVELLEESLQDIRDNLAALSFDIEKNEARQLLLKDPIVKALTFAEVESLDLTNPTIKTRLEELKNLSQFKGFWEVFQQVITSEWAKGEGESVARAIYCLNESRLLDTAKEYRSVIRGLEMLANKVRSWSPLTAFKVRGLIALFQLVNRDKYSEGLLRKLTTDLIEAQAASEIQYTDLTNWPNQLYGIEAELGALMRVDVFRTGVYEPLITDFKARNRVLTDGKFQALLVTLLEFSRADPAARGILNELAKSEVLLQFEKASNRSDMTSAVAIVTLLNHHLAALWTLPTNHQLYEGISEARPDVMPWFITLFMRYGDLGALLNLIGYNDQFKKFSLFTLQGLAARHASPDEQTWNELDIDLNAIRKHWPILENELWLQDPERESLLEGFFKFLVARTNVIGQIEKTGFDSDLVRLYGKLYSSGGKPQGLRNVLTQKFEEMPTSLWVDEFRKNGRLLDLALDIARADGFARPVVSAQTIDQALEQFADEVARGVATTDQVQTLGLLLGKETPEREAFRRKLLQIMSANRAVVSENFFRMFTSELPYRATTAEDASVLFSISRSFISSRNAPGLRWMSDVHVLDWLNPNQLNELASDVSAAFTVEKDDAAYPYLFPIAVNLNVNMLEPGSVDPRNYDDVDQHAATYAVRARKIVDIPGIQGLSVLRQMLELGDFYSLNRFVPESAREKVDIFTNPIQRDLDQLKREDVLLEDRERIDTRLSEVLRKIIAEGGAQPNRVEP